MKSLAACLLLSISLAGPAWGAPSTPAVDAVRVLKSKRTLQLLSGGKVVRQFKVALGGQPVGPKRREGDMKTPEGHFLLDYKKADSAFHKAIHVSYPGPADHARARKAGVSPGGMIMIHGQKNGYGHLAALTQRSDWTNGCIALTDADMDAVWQAVEAGTPIELRP